MRLLSALAIAAAASAVRSTPQLRARIDLIQVDAVVTDERGRPMRGLRATDFRLFEDGKPVDIAACREVIVSDAPIRPSVEGAVSPLSDPASEGRLLTLVIDDWHIPFSPRVLARTREILYRLIDGLRRDDRAALVGVSGRPRLQVDLTSDQARLREAVEAISPLPPVAAGTPVDLAESAWRGSSAMDVLGSLVRQLVTLSGRRKSVVLISTGVPFDLQGSPRDATARNMQDQFTALVRLAQREGVVFYAFDPTVMEDFSSAGQTNLRVLAEETGGFANVNNNSFEPGVARVLSRAITTCWSMRHPWRPMVGTTGLAWR